MKSEALKSFPWPSLTAAGLVIFVCLFLAILTWITLSKNQQRYKEAEQLPLDEIDTPIFDARRNLNGQQ